MIEGLHEVLENSGQPGLRELRDTLREILGGAAAAGKVVVQQRLKNRVHRLQIEVAGRMHSLVVKRQEFSLAQRNQLVVQRWLPAIGLGHACPRLLGVAAERSGRCVWHVYEDLGDWGLDTEHPDPSRVAAAVGLIAQLHTRAATHILLPECRKYGDYFGICYYASNVRDAIRALESLAPPTVDLSPDRIALRDRLLARLYRLLDELPARAQAMAELGGPETLLHGDLWPNNTLVLATPDGLQARLIDWDHAGVGPVSYDLSTFLSRFPPQSRPGILECYRRRVEQDGWRLPSPRDLNSLFDTAECARYANRTAWSVSVLREGEGEWTFDMLAEIERWFKSLAPVIPSNDKLPDHQPRRRRVA